MTSQVFDRTQHPDTLYIRAMFDKMASRYTLFARLIGFGTTDKLRRIALADLKSGDKVLDLGSGTGDMALIAMRKVGPTGRLTALDISSSMLEQTENRILALSPDKRSAWNMICLPAHEKKEGLYGHYDWVVSGFVLRNLYEHMEQVLDRVLDYLKPGGQIRFLDLTRPSHPLKYVLYGLYMKVVVGLYGLLLFGKNYPVFYLPDSSKRFLDREQFLGLLRDKGFTDCRARSFVLGCVTLYEAKKRTTN